MKTVVKIAYLVFSIILIIYLLLPGYAFPIPPSDALQSQEPADTETPLRRAYFTDYPRGEVLNHYSAQFKYFSILKIPIPSYRLNYPPEEAQTIIRDQTRSTFLEEVVHPLRESLFVNGFQAKSEKDTIIINNKTWLHKITVRYVPSNLFWRLIVGISLLALIPTIAKSWLTTAISLKKVILQKWTFR